MCNEIWLLQDKKKCDSFYHFSVISLNSPKLHFIQHYQCDNVLIKGQVLALWGIFSWHQKDFPLYSECHHFILHFNLLVHQCELSILIGKESFVMIQWSNKAYWKVNWLVKKKKISTLWNILWNKFYTQEYFYHIGQKLLLIYIYLYIYTRSEKGNNIHK